MKIEAITHERIEIALHETFRTAIRETKSISAIRVEIHAGGKIGVGYATATPAITGDTVERIESLVDAVVSPYLVGREVDLSGTAAASMSPPAPATSLGSPGSPALPRSPASLSSPTSFGSPPSLGSRGYVLGAQSNELFGIPSDLYAGWTAQCSSGVAAIDLALHDLLCLAPSIPASLVPSVTIGAGSIEDMVATAHRRVEAGFRVIKAKLGADPALDAQRLIALAQAVGAVRNSKGSNVDERNPARVEPGVGLGGKSDELARGPVQFWIDANQGWTVSQALDIFDAALDANVVLGVFEQPTPAEDIESLRQVRLGIQQRCLERGVVAVPVVADESARTLADIDRILATNAADVINVKFMKFGGITGCGMAVAKARSAGVGVLVGSMMEHPHSVAAAVRFAASLGGVHDLDAGWWAQDTSPLRYQDGEVSVGARS
jgi:L-alanine-DL-glutamate epimerase-like enolase superfamily enzyme